MCVCRAWLLLHAVRIWGSKQALKAAGRRRMSIHNLNNDIGRVATTLPIIRVVILVNQTVAHTVWESPSAGHVHVAKKIRMHTCIVIFFA